MTRILLVRHGESGANKDKFFAGHLDVDLSELGYQQAKCTADYIAKTYKVDMVYSSDLLRAYHTAETIAKMTGNSLKKKESLREINAGEWQGLAFDELQKKYADSYGVWLTDIGRAACLNGESVKELYERIWKALQEISEENIGKTVVVVTHATPICAICCRLQGFPVEEMKNVPWVSNASVTAISVENNSWELSQVSVDGYLSGLQTRFPANV